MKTLIAEKRTILLVDDESELLELIKEAVSSSFEQVLLAKDGAEACEILKQNWVDLVVTDYCMPKMNGLQLINFIKANHPFIPIIMLTGNSDNPEVIKALECGAFDIISKPYQKHILINRIQNGLLNAELAKTLWSVLSNDLSLPKLEEFLSKPITEQNRIIYAYSSIHQMKSLARAL